MLYEDLRGTLESKVWLRDGFTQDLLGRDGKSFKPSLPERFLFPISEVLPPLELIEKCLVKRNTKVLVALPADREMAVAAARPVDRAIMRAGLETSRQIYERQAHYDPETGRQTAEKEKASCGWGGRNRNPKKGEKGSRVSFR